MSRSRAAKAQRRQEFEQFLHHNPITIMNHTGDTARSHGHNVRDFPDQRRNRRMPELVPKSRGQEQLVMSLLDDRNDIVVVLGPAGTGKSYLAMLAALRDLRAGTVERIVLTRPAVGVEDERHGFLPGDLNRKMEPWTRPLLDIVREFYHPRDITRMIDDGVIEISPLAFMRGRTFRDSWIVADEMQNATPNQMKMLLTRIGSGSRIVVTGDVEQADRTGANNGLLDLGQKIQDLDIPGLKLCHLDQADTQRHPIINDILDLYAAPDPVIS